MQNSAEFRKTLQGIREKFCYYNIQDKNMNKNINMNMNIYMFMYISCLVKG